MLTRVPPTRQRQAEAVQGTPIGGELAGVVLESADGRDRDIDATSDIRLGLALPFARVSEGGAERLFLIKKP